jgi:hypothetical protein
VVRNTWGRLNAWWGERTGKQQLGYLLTVLAVLLTFGLAILRSGENKPSTGWVIFLAVLGIVAQAASAFSFGQVGKADPTHAQASVMHLSRLARDSKTARTAVESVLEKQPKPNVSELRDTLKVASVQLSYIEESGSVAIEHWRLFHEQAVRQVEDKDKEGNNGKHR